MQKLSCELAKQIDLTNYLASLGFYPQKIRHHDYWYLSPFRLESTASFKVNRQKNLWYDFGDGKGGDIIDFATRFFNNPVSEVLVRLSSYSSTERFSFHPPDHYNLKLAKSSPAAGEKNINRDDKILITDQRNIQSKKLLDYLDKRKIPLELANRFCKETDFTLYTKKYTVIGFKNNAGGYELRSPNFKGSSFPKEVKFIDNGGETVAVFEGFFSFLSFRAIKENDPTLDSNLPERQSNILVLNSLSLLERSRDKMEQHQVIHLYLDRDKAGLKATATALQWSGKYKDQSLRYKNFKDLNDYLTGQQLKQGISQKRGRHL
mgnify:CR=1 FL=1